MKTITEFDHKKATQTLNFFAIRNKGSIDKLRVLKLIWLSDRYHLRRYGRPIFNDVYFAMPYGPVASSAKDLTEDPEFLAEGERNYLREFLKCDVKNHKIISIKSLDDDVFSDSDLEAMEVINKEYGGYSTHSLVILSHDYPEWKRFEVALKSGSSTRENMTYGDFFKNQRRARGRYFRGIHRSGR